MKGFLIIVLLSLSCVVPESATTLDSLKYVNATGFQLLGKGSTEIPTRYGRLPVSMERVPILLVENVPYTYMYFNQTVFSSIREKNATLLQIYSGQKKRGERHLYYLRADKLIGNDFEGTVDGVHLTDLGFFKNVSEHVPGDPETH